MDREQQATRPGSDHRMFRFSAETFPRHKRATIFREYVQSRIARLDSCPVSENGCVDGVGMTLPNLGVVGVNITPFRCARTREVMHDGNDNLRLVVLHRSECAAPAFHLGRELTVEPGSAVVLSNCDLNAITFTGPRSRMLSLNLTRKMLRPLLYDFDVTLAHTIPKQTAALRLLAHYVEALLGDPALPTPELGQLAVAHIYDLAALAMGATRDAADLASNRGLAAARLREIKSNITANLSREGLSVVEIARRHRVTPRYVQMLFENEGMTFTEFVRNERLKRAHRWLTDRRFADRSISAIAFETGFSDLSYFNRTFRRRFGRTPSEVRAAHARKSYGVNPP